MQPFSFQNHFFATSMRQTFNDKVMSFVSDDTESAMTKWLRVTGKL
jgi:hypothetical protein